MLREKPKIKTNKFYLKPNEIKEAELLLELRDPAARTDPEQTCLTMGPPRDYVKSLYQVN